MIVIGRDGDGIDVDGSVNKPATTDEAQSTLERCVRTRIPTRVLVVDDSATMRGIVRKILSGSKFPLDVSEADGGTKALQELRNGTFDIVFLDYNMPGLNGFETLGIAARTPAGSGGNHDVDGSRRLRPARTAGRCGGLPQKALLPRGYRRGALSLLQARSTAT